MPERVISLMMSAAQGAQHECSKTLVCPSGRDKGGRSVWIVVDI